MRPHRIALIAVACTIVYAVALVLLHRDTSFREETFTSTPAPATSPIALYIDGLSFDPVRQAIDVRFDLAAGSTVRGDRYGGAFDRDIELSIGDGDSEQVVDVHRNEVGGAHLVSLDVRGAIAAYPFDRYRGDIAISALERFARGQARPISIKATVWEGIPGWVTSVRAMPATYANTALAIVLTVRRPLPVVSFAVVLYTLMVVVAMCSLGIGGLVFAGVRKVESTIVGALVAMVFSVAVLRNVLPGAPPIGITADVVIFLWAEIAVTAGLSLLVTAWVKRGPGG